MVSNVRMPNGVDTDSVWPARITSAISAVNVRASDTQDFANRYEKANGAGTSISANIRAPDGVDLSLKFTTIAALPKNFGPVNAFATAVGGNPNVTITFAANGAINGSGPVTDSWLTPLGAIGNQYQILHTAGTTSGTGTTTITFGSWLNLDSGQTLLIQKSGAINGTYVVTGSSQIRRKSDGVVVCSGSWSMTSERTS